MHEAKVQSGLYKAEPVLLSADWYAESEERVHDKIRYRETPVFVIGLRT